MSRKNVKDYLPEGALEILSQLWRVRREVVLFVVICRIIILAIRVLHCVQILVIAHGRLAWATFQTQTA